MSVFSWILYIIIALAVLLVMITIHELGHYTAGKLLKFKINEFSLGFGKTIYSKTKKNGEKFSIRVLPLGGFCAFEGEDEDKDTPGAFNKQAPWKRAIVLFMGPFFNFLSAIIFSFILLVSVGYVDKVQIASVDASAGLQQGDVVLAVDGVYTDFVYDRTFSSLTANYAPEEEFEILVRRDGKEQTIITSKGFFESVKSKTDGAHGTAYSLDGTNYNYYINGTSITRFDTTNNVDEKSFAPDANGNINIDGAWFKIRDIGGTPTICTARLGVSTQLYKYGFFEALGECFVFTVKWVWKVLIILWQLITFRLGVENLGGTVTTLVTIAEASHTNLLNLLILMPVISVNLAVFNLLPFPALDGARMVFVGIEGIRKKPVPKNVEGTIHFVGLCVLLAFVLVVDILHFVI